MRICPRAGCIRARIEKNAALEEIARVAVEAAHRQAASMMKIAAQARAISRGDVPENDRLALAATMRQLAQHCEHEAHEHARTMRAARSSPGENDETESDEDDPRWLYGFLPSVATH